MLPCLILTYSNGIVMMDFYSNMVEKPVFFFSNFVTIFILYVTKTTLNYTVKVHFSLKT